MNTHWNVENIPSLENRVALVTGGNSGVGYETAMALAGKGAHTIIAARNAEKCARAAEAVRRAFPEAVVETIALDLADLVSVHACAENFHARFQTLDILVNNAGVMAIPFRRTAQNLEMQFGTNHLGHFALTGLLLPAILAAPNARVVTVSSGLHQRGKIEFDNLDGTKKYNRGAAYASSKLANLLFAYALQRRFEQANTRAISVGCHPGYAATNLQSAGPRMDGNKFNERMMQVANRLFAQSSAMGALPLLYAATAPDVNGGDYIGPIGMMGMRGYPGKARSSELSHNVALAEKLWQVSEELTQVQYRFENTAVH